MRVVEGNFGKQDEKDKRPFRERLMERLETSGLGEETDVNYSMFVQRGDQIILVTNEDSMSDVFYFVDMFKAKYFNNGV